ncbi:zinc finger protein 431 [Ceratitis capitata]|uniref:zinc finger protein 431 n=1 Tax=Ceratitis capitata TaxID=7213 RepID=UPI0006188422|nr:zinc finger protein 431 [Ceratitis capitata]
MREITHKNMQSFCRICLDELGEKSVLLGEKYNIYENGDNEKLITLCPPPTIVEDSDDLPQFICKICHIKLESLHEFRCKALQSFTFLANILKDCDDSSGVNITLLDSGQGSVEQLDISVRTPKIEYESYKYSTRSREKLQNTIENTVVKIMQEPTSPIKTTKEVFKNEIFVGEEAEIDIKDIKTDENIYSDCEDTSDEVTFLRTDSCTHDEADRLQNVDIAVQALDIHAKTLESDADLSNGGTSILLSTKNSSQNKNKKSTKTPKGLKKSKTKVKTTDDCGPLFQCEQCPRRCVTKENFEAHLRTHQGLKPYVCNECNRDFNRASNFRSHMREAHAAVKLQFVCSFEGCGKIFNRRDTYTAHYRHKHSKEYTKSEPKIYVCEDCGSTFKNATTFKEHRYKHAPVEEHPFKCEECGKRYRSKRSYNEHKIRHSGIKNFICPYCGMKKVSKRELRTHLNYHTKEKQWPCPKCPSIFNSSANLGMHDRIVHKGIRRFSCRYCEQSFGKADTLKHHEMRHTGEKPHGCELCGKRFIQVVALRTHLKTHSRDNSRGPRKQASTEVLAVKNSTAETCETNMQLTSACSNTS